ncbi:MAG: crotonase/enoyl-CoA hydratase family protein [Proteobacteria bacterium]|nr:crotonase/enoyl-CoA hydratase family protein [Pseudomonadota bacterium]
MNYEQILYNVDQGILTLTLNRPDKLNAFTHTMLRELLDALDKADADDEVRVIIVTGAGRGFCAGADLSAGAGTFNHADEDGRSADTHRDGGGLLTLRLYECRKPLIAAINGAAVGVGVTMTLPMDIRLASSEARFGFVFARRGIVPEAASSWFLPRIVGVSQALQWAYSGRVFPAAEALAARLVNEMLAPEELLPRARAIATEIVENTSAVSITMIRHMMWRMLSEDHPMAAHRIDSRSIYELGQGADAKEGVSSFLDKRAPKFPGKVSRDMPDFFPWWETPKF